MSDSLLIGLLDHCKQSSQNYYLDLSLPSIWITLKTKISSRKNGNIIKNILMSLYSTWNGWSLTDFWISRYSWILPAVIDPIIFLESSLWLGSVWDDHVMTRLGHCQLSRGDWWLVFMTAHQLLNCRPASARWDVDEPGNISSHINLANLFQ